MTPEQKGKLKNLKGIFAEHNGKECKTTSTKGVSGETTLVHFDGSKGLYITDDQFEATP